MMTPATAETLYREIILAHHRQPVGFEQLPEPGLCEQAHNPLCGDELKLGLALDGDRIEAIGFKGRACAICIASASILCELARGRSVRQVLELHRQLERAWQGEDHAVCDNELVAALAAVRAYPVRIQCARLGWDVFARLAGSVA